VKSFHSVNAKQINYTSFTVDGVRVSGTREGNLIARRFLQVCKTASWTAS